MKKLLLSDIIAANRILEEKIGKKKKFTVVILSNITCALIKDVLEYCLRRENVPASVVFGDYDNIVQDSQKFHNADAVVIFWELSNIVEGLQYKANVMDQTEIDELVSEIQNEINLVFSNLHNSPLVVMNTFSTLLFNHHLLRENNYNLICRILNDYIRQIAPDNIVIVDIDKVIAQTSIEKSADFRFYYSAKALYTIDFLKNYSLYIKQILFSINKREKKAVIFDCDNSLWMDTLFVSWKKDIISFKYGKSDAVIKEIQSLVRELNQSCSIFGVCGKEKMEDLAVKPENVCDSPLKGIIPRLMPISWNHINPYIQDILNISELLPEDFVFISDSETKNTVIRQNFPQITVIQLPVDKNEYPSIIRCISSLFFTLSSAEHDEKDTIDDRQTVKSENNQAHFDTIEDYLRRLDLFIKIYINPSDKSSQIAELSHAANRFNLTARKYTASDIQEYIENPQMKVIGFHVSDRFNDFGTTGLCIVNIDSEKESAMIDSFLLSCKVMGREIEYKFFNHLIDFLKLYNIKSVEAEYVRTNKNDVVSHFYEGLGFQLLHESSTEKKYFLKIEDYIPKNIDYILLE